MLLRLLAAAVLLASCSPALEPGRAASGAAVAEPIFGVRPVDDMDSLVSAVGGARFVAMGEATHGTHEFYRERARLSEQLIERRGFGAVVIEADWPETERVNLYVRGLGSDRTARQALAGYTRFPRWMWRNAEFADFVERLRAQNLARPPAERVGIYGMDVYNLSDAIAGTTSYLDETNPAVAARVRAHYRCFEPYGGDTQRYGRAARRRSCQAAAEAALSYVRQLARPSDPIAAEAYFSAIRNAASVVGAEEYFRTLYAGSYSWNARDRRMTATIGEVADHVSAMTGLPGRVVVWAHNSHVGDARATDASRRGELNLGQLLRETHGEEAFLLGFLTYGGSVVAASDWDAPAQVRRLRPALPESDAGVLHQAGLSGGLLLLRGAVADPRLSTPRPQRAVGVIYRPETERQSHYFTTILSQQFDAVIYLEQTRALTPLD